MTNSATADTARIKRAFERAYFRWVILTAPVFYLVTGLFLQKFTLLAHISKSVIGLSVGIMSLLPAVVGYLVVPAISRRGWRVRLYAASYTVRFLLISVLSLLPWLFSPDATWGPALFYTLVMGFIALGYTLGNVLSDSLIRDAVPAERFGRFGAKMGIYAALLTIPPSIGCAYVADAHQGIAVLQGILFFGGITGALITLPLFRIKEWAVTTSEDAIPLLMPLKDKVYRRYLYMIGIQSFVMIGATSFWGFYFLDELKIPVFTLVLISAGCQLISPFASWGWGIINDHFSPKSLFILSNLFTWTAVLLLFIPIPKLLCVILFSLFLGFYGTGGILTRGRDLAMGTLRNAMMPESHSAVYVGAFQIVVGSAGFASGIVAGSLLQHFQGQTYWGLSGYKLLFLFFNVFAGIATTIPFYFLKERQSRPVHIGKLAMTFFNPFAYRDLFTITRSRAPHSVDKMEQTTARLADRTSYLGRTELLNRLHSPSLRVKRQAIRGLGNIHDPLVLTAIREEALQPNSSVAYECINALETLKAEETILSMFEGYGELPRELRLRLVIAALNLGTTTLRGKLETILVRETDLDIATEIILGLAGKNGWKTGITALDLLSLQRLTDPQRTRLWMAIGTLFDQRDTAVSFMAAEQAEIGSGLENRYWSAVPEPLVRAYHALDRASFHQYATTLLLDQRPDWWERLAVNDQTSELIDFILQQIVATVQDPRESEARLAMLVAMIAARPTKNNRKNKDM